jgi:hypothetical protein
MFEREQMLALGSQHQKDQNNRRAALKGFNTQKSLKDFLITAEMRQLIKITFTAADYFAAFSLIRFVRRYSLTPVSCSLP